MKFPFRIHRKFLRRVALGLATAALAATAVPLAQGMPGRAYQQPQLDGASLPCTPSCPDFGAASGQDNAPVVLHRSGYVVGSEPVRPNDRAVHGVGTPAGQPFAGYRALPGQVGVPTSLSRTSDLSWSDAGIGIAIGAAFSILLGGMGVVITRRRDRLARA
jgi:hypothetical protein